MTSASKTCYALALFLILLVDARLSNAQRARGELRIEVHDPQGAAVAPTAELVSDANQFRRTFQLATDGAYVIQDLAFGLYRLTVTDAGFAPWSTLVEVRSEVPVLLSIKLGIAPVAMQVQVSDAATLLDAFAWWNGLLDRATDAWRGCCHTIGTRPVRLGGRLAGMVV